jgi:hypothetical protein
VQLPGAESAIIAENKIRGYLLSSSHSQGKGKARFFNIHGFRLEEWETLANSLKEHALTQSASLSEEIAYGSLYEVDGRLLTPNGTSPIIRVIWFIESGAV